MHSDDADLKLFEGRDPFTPTPAVLHRGTTEFIGHLDEVALYYRLHHDKGYGVFAASQSLYTIVDTPTISVRIKWVARVHTTDGLVAKKRHDFCVLEGRHVVQPRGKSSPGIVVMCWTSIDMACCPPVPGIVRGVMYPSGVVCIQAPRPGYLHMSAIAHIDANGPHAMAIRASRELCHGFAQVELRLRQTRLSTSSFLLERDLRPLDSRRACFLCQRSFSAFRKKTHCLKCGEVMCTACNPKWSVLVNGHHAKRRACTLCSLACGAPSNASTTAKPPTLQGRRWDEDLSHPVVVRMSDASSFGTDDSMSRYSDSVCSDGYRT
ncbi:hypothetical protein H310_12771 [Aphanomyces invadans]|uniref:FYVE-type domain-containing protein n=1 Tax=Aphanomyces invadans TaxID=157072 RepID=A0A024TGI3_9STRA|nr:hypothetical protein H310_12771 [Aphanomyces invadans]ETV93163.1 hypothetical protein H310_12771 [Aphanomyces invadans]|eukprot:XP_008878185.1 hypothetical protein H310_12771 [Aphanomyces invadans]